MRSSTVSHKINTVSLSMRHYGKVVQASALDGSPSPRSHGNVLPTPDRRSGERRSPLLPHTEFAIVRRG
jgi:hypothetical protein